MGGAIPSTLSVVLFLKKYCHAFSGSLFIYTFHVFSGSLCYIFIPRFQWFFIPLDPAAAAGIHKKKFLYIELDFIYYLLFLLLFLLLSFLIYCVSLSFILLDQVRYNLDIFQELKHIYIYSLKIHCLYLLFDPLQKAPQKNIFNFFKFVIDNQCTLVYIESVNNQCTLVFTIKRKGMLHTSINPYQNNRKKKKGDLNESVHNIPC